MACLLLLLLLILLLSGVLLDDRLEDLGDVLGVQAVVLKCLLKLGSLLGVRLKDRPQLRQRQNLLKHLL